MSAKHPIIAVTGSSGAGTSSITRTFQYIFRARGRQRGDRRGRLVPPLRPQGDEGRDGRGGASRATPTSATSAPRRTSSRSSRRCSAATARAARGRAAQVPAQRGGGRAVQAGAGHLHRLGGDPARTPTSSSTRACTARWPPATWTSRGTPTCSSAWCRSSTSSGSRSCTATSRCAATRPEAVVDTILRRMPDYVNYICPQFSRTHINFQRVPTVDTSNPFIARWIPTAGRELRGDPLREPEGIDFPYLLSMMHDSVHVAREHDRGARRQDGARHAAHPHAADPAS